MNITETIEFWQEVQQDFQKNATTLKPYFCNNSNIFYKQWHDNNTFIKYYASYFLKEYPQFEKLCFIGSGVLFVCDTDVSPTLKYEIRETFLRWIINYLFTE